MKRALAIIEPARSPSIANFKTLNPQIVGNQYKYVFIVDESGSNASQSTDPTGSRRFDNIVNFIDAQIAKGAQGTYAMIRFSSAAVTIIPFTGDPVVFRAAVLTEKANRLDNGGTNYTQALSTFRTEVTLDAAACAAAQEQIPAYYVAFFLSDGVPSPTITDPELVTLFQSIDNIVNTNSRCVNGIQVNTGWYHNGPPNPTAPEAIIMQRVAVLGHGQFIDFADGGVIDLSRYQIPEVRIQIKLVDVLIENRNIVWENGKLKLDSDSDNLSDDLETTMRSLAGVKDSDANGVSDFIEFYLYGKPCNGVLPPTAGGNQWSGSCTYASSQDFRGACSDVIASQTTTSVVFKDTDGLGFNDCEKRLLGGRTDRWDSNGDWIPDGFEFLRGLNFIAGTHQENADPFNNGMTNREKLKRGMPIDVDARTIPTFKPFDYTLFQVSKDAVGISYSIEIRNIPIIGDGNLIRVYLFENTLGLKDRRFVRFAEQRITSDQGTKIINSDFSKPVYFDCSTTDPCY